MKNVTDEMKKKLYLLVHPVRQEVLKQQHLTSIPLLFSNSLPLPPGNPRSPGVPGKPEGPGRPGSPTAPLIPTSSKKINPIPKKALFYYLFDQ
jgi:hypothetical protein